MFRVIFQAIEPTSCKSYDVKGWLHGYAENKIDGGYIVTETQ